jgi:hypothetical protein
MSSLENRSASALFKRAEQLKRWQESDTWKEPSEPKRKNKKIQVTASGPNLRPVYTNNEICLF